MRAATGLSGNSRTCPRAPSAWPRPTTSAARGPTAAQYTVTWVDQTSTPRNQTFSINQQVAANDINDKGIWWERLGVTFQVRNAATLTVRLSDQGGATVAADAVRVEQLSSLLAEAPASGARGRGGRP